MKPEIVFRRQSAKTQDFSAAPGGRVFFTPEMCAALCGKLKPKYYLAGLLKYADDWSSASRLEYLLWIEVSEMANKNHWRPYKDRKEFWRSMCGLALCEISQPRKYNNHVVRATALNIKPWSWHKKYKWFYEEIYKTLDSWAEVAYETVKKRC